MERLVAFVRASVALRNIEVLADPGLATWFQAHGHENTFFFFNRGCVGAWILQLLMVSKGGGEGGGPTFVKQISVIWKRQG